MSGVVSTICKALECRAFLERLVLLFCLVRCLNKRSPEGLTHTLCVCVCSELHPAHSENYEVLAIIIIVVTFSSKMI